MRRHNINIKGVARRLSVACLLLFAWAGIASAQSNDPQYVIKVGANNHYMAHVYNTTTSTWQITDVDAFDPATCLWYSGPNIEHNYYFLDQSGNYRYLGAPLTTDGTLFLSTTHPGTVVLNKKDGDYYFYDWDRGVARGVQLPMEECEAHSEYNGISGNQCWKVVWLAYESSSWKMSPVYNYNPVAATYAVPYRHVTVTSHEEEILNEAGGITDLVIPGFTLEYNQSVQPNGTALEPVFTPTAYSYDLKPAYTQYDFAAVHNVFFDVAAETHYDTSDDQAPSATSSGAQAVVSYLWEIDGDGASYLNLTDAATATPTLTCNVQNTENSHQLATLTLTVTYEDGSTQTRSATVTVKTQCQNPQQASAPVVTYEDVTVSWYATAENYKVYWKKSDPTVTAWNSDEVDNVSSYAITGLDYGTNYDYKVSAYCSGAYQEVPDGLIYHFTTKQQPNALVYGAVFGGGRMADVGGKTEVVIINCDSISAVYGGNDIAGSVLDTVSTNPADQASATITLGVNSGDSYDSYGTTTTSIGVKVGSVYGGGNGYYAYDGSSFVAADDEHTSFVVPDGGTVRAMTPSHAVGDSVWGNNSGADKTLEVPTIVNTAITVAESDYVKVDSLFGGAKNAFLTANNGNGSAITVKGGTIFAVFGGNNFGGTQGYGKHHIEVQGTKTNNAATTGYGRDFGIGYVFGGGNKVYGSTTEIFITGGQCDTVFAGGNSADVYAANVTVNCAPDKTISSATITWDDVNISEVTNYDWDGTGVYNVRTLFGGNNQAQMNGLPTINLTSGAVGTVYGGGNAGDMMAQTTGGAINFNNSDLYDFSFDYSTKVMMTSPSIMVDYLYGGCQMSNVGYSTWVQIQNGHVGTVYGGCNISGDVGSTRVDLDADPNNEDGAYQEVYGATYVEASGGVVHKNLFAGSNGFYHCLDSYGVSYVQTSNPEIVYDPAGHTYYGMHVPTHNETHAVISGTAVINGNVYAGGNMAPVGFTTAYVSQVSDVAYPSLVGLASVRMVGGEVKGNVYGGGNMASINGGNEVRVTAGSIGTGPEGGALYGGNDRLGKAGCNGMSNRKLPDSYNTASDNYTSLVDLSENVKVNTYICVTGNPYINTVYGGGNGAYDYSGTASGGDMDYCDATDLPIQDNIFVDIAIDGSNGDNGPGHIDYVYGGGNGVYATGFVKVFINVRNMGDDDDDHIGTIFGGNNMGDLDIVPDIILLNGNVNTIYGGCNSGAMIGSKTVTSGDGTDYTNVGSYVRLRDSYPTATDPVVPNVKVSGAIYGGCRSNGVTNNTLVLVESGEHEATLFGGSDISGDVAGLAHIVMKDGRVGNIYGGGNGHYDYGTDYVGLLPPYCDETSVEMLGGTCTGSVFGGGYAGECGDTYLLVDGGTVNGSIYGGGNEAGVVVSSYTDLTDPENPVIVNTSTGSSTIEMNSGVVVTGVYGGCNTIGNIGGDVTISILGGTIGTDDTHIANIFGGGYGKATTVAGDVDIQFGEAMYDDISGEEIHNENLVLFGDLYGGSAKGSVNTDNSNSTTIHIDNGIVHGNVYGGGLGYKDAENPAYDVAAKVYGEVRVSIGGNDNGTFYGLASFEGRPIASVNGGENRGSCIFGCNNINGSPQDLVFIDVYQTLHTDKDVYTYYSADDREYAIYQVFGGGNQANYSPENGILTSTKETQIYIHGCYNTIQEVFGGSNAAHSNSAATIVEGGRFDFVFGGGNGILGEANVGTDDDYHRTYSQILGGRLGWCFGGSNRLGTCINITQDVESDGSCGELIIEYLFQGGNQADQYGELVLNFTCEANETYTAAYGGCRLGTVYGNITVNMSGGTIGSLFGGCQGSYDWPAHVKRFPTQQEINDAPDGTYPQEVLNFLTTQAGLGNDWYGKGGNITVIVKGGAIGNLYGGCDNNGNVDGKITIIVEEEGNSCGLFIGNIYGASNHMPYAPEDPDLVSPKVNIIKGTIGGEHDGFNGTPDVQPEERFAGNVFGGGNQGDVTSNPKVNIGDGSANKAVTILGSVFGGGDKGDVNGNPQVVIVPGTHNLTVNPPQISGTSTNGGGTVEVGTHLCSTIASENIAVGEDVDISITAIPAAATSTAGYLFDRWTVTGTDAIVGNPTFANTSFTMGTDAATLTATFRVVDSHTLTMNVDGTGSGTGTFKVNGETYSGPVWVAQGATVTVQAIPAPGSIFNHWDIVSGSGSIIGVRELSTTTFTMGTENAILKAVFTSSTPTPEP